MRFKFSSLMSLKLAALLLPMMLTLTGCGRHREIIFEANEKGGVGARLTKPVKAEVSAPDKDGNQVIGQVVLPIGTKVLVDQPKPKLPDANASAVSPQPGK